MSGSAPQNNQAVSFEEQQAAQAQQQEAQRQAALTQGTAAINAIYDYSPATPASSAAYDWSTFQAPTGYDASGNPTGGSGVPSGYKAVDVTTPGNLPRKWDRAPVTCRSREHKPVFRPARRHHIRPGPGIMAYATPPSPLRR